MRWALAGWCCIAAVQALAAPADRPNGWSGAGWYQVLHDARGPVLLAGPYDNELACKKAMNVAQARRSCVELHSPPPPVR